MNQIESWDHKWFGWWRESGEYEGPYEDGYFNNANGPSIRDFVQKGRYEEMEKKKIITYLETAYACMATSRMAVPCAFTGQTFRGSLCVRTDGVWYWQDDLPYYMSEHHVCVPERMLANIRGNGYMPPKVTRVPRATLDRLLVGTKKGISL